MNRKRWIKSSLLLVSGVLAGAVVSHVVTVAHAEKSDYYEQLTLFGEVLDRVRADYVEVPEDKKLIESAINGMLFALDPHSSYMDAERFDEMQIQTKGEFGGLGIEVTMENGVVKVITPIDDTPASKAGFLSNDLITHIDKEQIMGLTLTEAVDKMRGPVGTPVTLTVVRKGKDEPFEVTLVRDLIRVKSVKFSVEGADKDVGYIRLSSFTEQTQEGLDDAIKSLRKEIGPGIKGWVLDLRNNPGGLLDQARTVSDTFLARGEIVSTRGRHAGDTQRFDANSGDLLETGPVVVLINGGSASASEIVAGALQDNKRAQILGTRSFGKGSVQTVVPLGGRGALRLTTARYYTPSGTSIQAKGIVPDFVVEEPLPPDLKPSQARLEGEASLPGHLKSEGGGEEEKGSSSYVPQDRSKDTQLKAALDLLHGKSIEKVTVHKAPSGGKQEGRLEGKKSEGKMSDVKEPSEPKPEGTEKTNSGEKK